MNSIEFSVLHALEPLRANEAAEQFWLFVTHLGDAGFVWFASGAVMLCFSHTRKAGGAVLAALFVGWLICNLSLKPLVERLRPCDIAPLAQALLACPRDTGFPSGHSTSSFAAATALATFFPRVGIVALVLAALIALSRLVLFVHFPSDIVFGTELGILCGLAGAAFVRRAAGRSNLLC